MSPLVSEELQLQWLDYQQLVAPNHIEQLLAQGCLPFLLARFNVRNVFLGFESPLKRSPALKELLALNGEAQSLLNSLPINSIDTWEELVKQFLNKFYPPNKTARQIDEILQFRPLNDDEQRINVPKAITCNESKREVSVLQNVANKQVDKVFTFDKVFGPKAQQRSIYDQAISPIVKEVLDGFNCTVFAYGQTGTGKTYTMEGGMRNKAGELPAEAGIIPRAVRQIFDTLEGQNADYSMKVTFWELYNEEITDLLASEEPSKSSEERQKKPVSLMEDGKGCVVVRGLEEEAVYSANDIYNLLERGAARRRTADTLLNKRSSRSHSVFSITIHVKEMTVGDEELIKCGKLNLVDLAGSENISRSGAREARAREAGEINKSLLTLGRVITALVEHSIHIA
uniref:Kinesin-like protein n=1 Tax=Nicotiana sylvestris TaxID=4096 RepID=A0A1U7WUA0_NICSY|nr:PREDICTED: probable 125 kDa kinesin-related protein [Nicotiana sylvestris]